MLPLVETSAGSSDRPGSALAPANPVSECPLTGTAAAAAARSGRLRKLQKDRNIEAARDR